MDFLVLHVSYVFLVLKAICETKERVEDQPNEAQGEEEKMDASEIISTLNKIESPGRRQDEDLKSSLL